MKALQGWAVWAFALLAAWTLPGALWKAAAPPPFPWGGLAFAGLLLVLLAGTAMAGVMLAGPRLARARPLSLLDGPPDFLWAGLALALWPAAWQAPGWTALGAAFLAAALPAELRWLGQALPPERPLPEAWGARAVRRSRWAALRHLFPHWLAARLPVWITATLVMERILGLRGLGSDWMDRVAFRDRAGMALWVLALALLWALLRRTEGRRT